MLGFILDLLEEVWCGDVGDFIAVELNEWEHEDDAHKTVEVDRVEHLGLEHLVELTLGYAIVACIELEGWLQSMIMK